ncbi:hypothetical protein [Staphylococcus gallinarum]|uniref:hypothetical protein n=1 Tax=Staphylococcus gallinarum TaxID=1293 RepID=UPI003F54494F
MENLYVVIDEYNDVKGVYEEDELQEFVNDYSVELANEIQRNYTIQEQFDFHLEILGKMSEYYNGFTISKDNLKNFLACYNVIAPDKLRYEIIQVVDEVEMQEFISYVNETENGYQKYKDNNYQIPSQTIIVHHPEDIQNSQVYKKDVHQIDEIIERIVIVELKRLKNVQTEDILENKSSYLMSLLEIYQDLEENRFLDKPSNDLLIRLKELFDDEYMLLGVEIKIEYSNKPISENKDSSNVATFEHVIKK